jgi:hypothetical protein
MFKSGVKALEFELKALILRFKEAGVALGDKNSRDKRVCHSFTLTSFTCTQCRSARFILMLATCSRRATHTALTDTDQSHHTPVNPVFLNPVV